MAASGVGTIHTTETASVSLTATASPPRVTTVISEAETVPIVARSRNVGGVWFGRARGVGAWALAAATVPITVNSRRRDRCMGAPFVRADMC